MSTAETTAQAAATVEPLTITKELHSGQYYSARGYGGILTLIRMNSFSIHDCQA